MSFIGKKRIQKSIRKPIPTTSSEDESTTIINKKKESKIKSSSHLSFHQEQEEDILQIKIKRNNLNERPSDIPLKSESLYSSSRLQELISKNRITNSVKADSNKQLEEYGDFIEQVPIPDPKTIQHLKKKREEKRINSSKQVVFVPLDSRVSESRLMTEDQEIEGEEAFDDYSAKTIAFGSNAVVKAEQERKLAMQVDLLETQELMDQDDSDIQEWEDQVIRQGQIKKMEKNSLEKNITTFTVPHIQPLVPFQDSFDSIEKILTDLEWTCSSNFNQLTTIDGDISSSKGFIKSQGEIIQIRSENYNFYQELKDFVSSFAEFLDDKDELLILLENDFYEYLSTRVRMDMDVVDDELDELYGQLSTLSSISHLMTSTMTSTNRPRISKDAQELWTQKHDIQDQQSHFLDDVEEEYCSIMAIRQRFESWKAKFPTDYSNCFATLSLPGLFEVHLRLEMLLWDPLNESTSLESFQWHQYLLDYGNEPEPLLLQKMVTTFVIPKFKNILANFELHHTPHVLALLNQLLDYTESSAPAFKGILVVIEGRIQEIIQDFKTRFPPLNDNVTLHVNGIDCPSTRMGETKNAIDIRNQWINSIRNMYSLLLQWKRFIPSSLLSVWAIQDVLNTYSIPFLLIFPLERHDLVVMESLVQPLPSEWIPTSGHSTPTLLNELETLLKKFYESTKHELDSQDLNRLSGLFVKIQSLYFASIVSSIK